jgi:hypothetical protein
VFATFLLVAAAVALIVPLRAIDAKATTLTGWRRINVGRVSFYVPPRLRRTGVPGNRGVIAALSRRNNEPYLYYAYGPHVPCAEPSKPTIIASRL